MSEKWVPPKSATANRHRWTIDDKKSCEQAILAGISFVCLSSALTFSLVLYNYLVGLKSKSLAEATPVDALFDVVIFLALSFLTYRKSRISSVLVFILYSIELLLKFTDSNTPHGLMITWGFFMFAAVLITCRRTFLWQEKHKEEIYL
ncbi:hypothetical protein ACU60T_23900 [Klebsiella aerogenes]